MFKVFVEYSIKPQAREDYLLYMRQWLNREGRMQLLEGSDQPGLFVEIWDGVTYEEYIMLKTHRKEPGTSGDAAWDQWVIGGKAKVNIWHFTNVI